MECSYILRLIAFTVSLIVDSIDTISDWLLYHDVVAAKEGLVFGHFDDTLTTTLLAFSILGSCLFLFEIITLGVNLTRDDLPILLLDVVALLVIWVEDVPQIIINVVIVACRDQPISVVQIIKASICMLGALMKLMIAIVRFCYWKRKEEKLGSEGTQSVNKWVRIITFPGILLIMLGSIMVFSFTQLTWDNADGSLKFQNPRRLLDGEYNTDKYFDQVGVYVNFESKDSGPTVNMATNQWIRLVDIYDFGERKNTIVTHVTFGLGASKFLSVQKPPGSHASANFSECYVKTGASWSLQSSLSRCAVENQPTVSAVIQLQFVEPEGHLLLGDIEFNSKVYQDTTCNSAIVPATPLPHLSLSYFKSRLAITSGFHHMVVSGTVMDSEFYSTSQLQPITEIWKTGFLGCKFTGKSQPTFNPDISVPCL
ncbi:uncharacterized protein LOC132552504 [Ylistrum balloti]|uniref:uncharacterized protein LOC132552504 n=1 Tax=Ylistrum balloti TaxID=509963 RepID=UPI002905DB56|nr:uncharacterized protein LOC132552504 [Ylistrum balloti]XP_060072667.1 uncharacterized protein LOC132552504 [Ylistrum balloti]XP_060072668.1 uncharacterized protein LOC132552504 [Ylistrum balloti]XP_060072669.1 uncharacterized protein LOC132552504 [Ylistrum balloti]XP_060072670.1 uncharacterized protein LOC132552504 [Ylistrum balloti]